MDFTDRREVQPAGLPRAEIHFMRTRDGLVELDQRELLTMLIGNLVETGGDHAWIGEVRCCLVTSPGQPQRRALNVITRAVRLPLIDGCVPEHISERAVAAFSGAPAILDSFPPHEAWTPTAQEQRVIEAAVSRRAANLTWFLFVAGEHLFADGAPGDQGSPHPTADVDREAHRPRTGRRR